MHNSSRWRLAKQGPALNNGAEIQKTSAENLAHPCTFFPNKVQGFAAQKHPLTPVFPRYYVRFATLHFLATMCKVSGPVQEIPDAGPCRAGLCVFEKRSRVFRATKGRPTPAPWLNRLRMADRAENSQGFILQWLTAMCRLWPSQIAFPLREMAEGRNLFSQIILRSAPPRPHGPRGGEVWFRLRGKRMKKAAAFRPPRYPHTYYTHSFRPASPSAAPRHAPRLVLSAPAADRRTVLEAGRREAWQYPNAEGSIIENVDRNV